MKPSSICGTRRFSAWNRNGAALSGVLEADKACLLESLKGKTMPDGYWREARKHKAVSVKEGISDEYSWVCAAVEGGGKGYPPAAGSEGFYKQNEVNGYHRFIRERNRRTRGFAAKYLNRDNALFPQAFRGSALPADEIYKMLSDRGGRYRTITAPRTEDLFSI